ncbi:MAG: hypothetical protein CM15mP31_0800 [Gammaproteobacteria bacterium]|nr:MAG: hypothetical protein CM15mP31_0800 [Gammaproteobacteria bacterium]
MQAFFENNLDGPIGAHWLFNLGFIIKKIKALGVYVFLLVGAVILIVFRSIDRTLYPKRIPLWPWGYMYFYYENFDLASKKKAEDPTKRLVELSKPRKNIKGV